MRIAASARIMDEREILAVQKTSLRILDEIGVEVQNKKFLDRLAQSGATVDMNRQVVRFSPAYVEKFMAESEKFDWSAVKPEVSAGAGVYAGPYLDPETDEFTTWTEKRLADYAKLAYALENINCVSLLGNPVAGLDRRVGPLYHRLFCWKYGLAQGGGSIWDTRLCPFIYEMCEYMAGETKRPVKDYFRGMVFLSNTLKLPSAEAEQFMYFAEKGLYISVCNMSGAGGTAPVTIAGALALYHAQILFSNIVSRVFYGTKSCGFGAGIAPYDMRSLIYAYGRPEIPLWGLMIADMAKYFGFPAGANGGGCDAKVPGAEAAYQKALGSIPALFATGNAHVNAGTLSIDEVCSPIQMILDNEYLGALKRLAAGCEVNEETLAFNVVKEVGIGNSFIDHEHTVAHFREELWEPKIWSREMFDSWKNTKGAITDVMRARELHREIMKNPQPAECKLKLVVCGLAEGQEKHLKDIIERAKTAL